MQWQADARCRDLDPHLFYGGDGEVLVARRVRETAAVAVCRGCAVLAACRQHALGVPERWGVWGGLTEDQRRLRRPRGERAA